MLRNYLRVLDLSETDLRVLLDLATELDSDPYSQDTTDQAVLCALLTNRLAGRAAASAAVSA